MFDKTSANYPCKEVTEIAQMAYTMWQQGWDERNSGNISYLIDEGDLISKDILIKVKKEIPINFHLNSRILDQKLMLITASGSYFRSLLDSPEVNMGLVRINLTKMVLEVLWGFENHKGPTSELPTHLLCHEVRLQNDTNHRVIVHNHPTHIIALTQKIQHKESTIVPIIWKSLTESIFIFPEGIGVLPWMVPGTWKLGVATAKKMEKFRVVIWPNHGILSTGNNVEEAYGLIEIVEKAAEIYHIVGPKPEYSISDEQLLQIIKEYNLTVNTEFLCNCIKGADAK